MGNARSLVLTASGAVSVGIPSRKSQARPGKPKGRPTSLPMNFFSMRLEVLSRRLMSAMVLFEAVWLENPASQSGPARLWTVLEGPSAAPEAPGWRPSEL